MAVLENLWYHFNYSRCPLKANGFALCYANPMDNYKM